LSERVVFVGGQFVPEGEATISVLDHVVLYGDGVFETVVAWDGRIFKLDRHLDRLFRSLAAIQLEPPHSREELDQIIRETVRRNDLERAYIKLIITRGSNGQPFLDPAGCEPVCIVFARPYLYMAAPERIENGLRVKTVAIRRPPAEVLDPHVKSLNYLNLVLAKLEAQAARSDEALLLDIHGHVCEAPGYNVFSLRDHVLRTPKYDILEGITRETIIELAPDLGFVAEEDTLELYDLYTADEVIFCSTAGGILPVVEIDGRRIGAGRPGRGFEQIRDTYIDMLASGERSTPVADPVPPAGA
jgi:branched-chain amino acid aminotransferase